MAAKLNRAVAFAAEKHVTQFRKYDGTPYIVHPVEVMMLVNQVTDDEDMLCAAILHDVVEDTDTSLADIREEFGFRVADLVDDLTERTFPGNRKVRKAAECARLSDVDPDAKTIKLADLISNTRSIVKHDPKFAKIYLAEKRELLRALKGGNETLMLAAQRSLARGFADLSLHSLMEEKSA